MDKTTLLPSQHTKSSHIEIISRGARSTTPNNNNTPSTIKTTWLKQKNIFNKNGCDDKKKLFEIAFIMEIWRIGFAKDFHKKKLNW